VLIIFVLHVVIIAPGLILYALIILAACSFFVLSLYFLDATNASMDALSVVFQSPRELAENLVSSGQNRQLFDKTRCSVWRLI
jgi:hypothetical protein